MCVGPKQPKATYLCAHVHSLHTEKIRTHADAGTGRLFACRWVLFIRAQGSTFSQQKRSPRAVRLNRRRTLPQTHTQTRTHLPTPTFRLSVSPPPPPPPPYCRSCPLVPLQKMRSSLVGGALHKIHIVLEVTRERANFCPSRKSETFRDNFWRIRHWEVARQQGESPTSNIPAQKSAILSFPCVDWSPLVALTKSFLSIIK